MYAFGYIGLPIPRGYASRLQRMATSMLELTERTALQIVVLRTAVKQERYGATHQHNWKKVGLSRANYTANLATEERRPTARAAAAFRFLLHNNKYYQSFHTRHRELLGSGSSLNVSSHDLFAVHRGIECAIPVERPGMENASILFKII